MKLKTKVCLTILSVVLGALAIWGIGSIIYNHSDWTYTGKEVFNTVEEYNQFKARVGDMEYSQVQDLKLLSSEPPIVAFFTVKVLHNADFPYGVHDRATDWIIALVGSFIPIMALWVMPINLAAIWK